MKRFEVKGMSCAACQNRVERAVSSLDGVDSCAVSLLTNTMTVEGTIANEEIISAVVKAGYSAKEISKDKNTDNFDKNGESDKVLKRLISSVVLLSVLMYFSMGHSMLNFPLPPYISHNAVVLGIIQLIFSTAVMIINRKFFINGFKGALRLSANMDTLVAMGSAASYIYSLAMLYNILIAQLSFDTKTAMQLLHGLYFESAAMILTLVTVGKFLESRSKEKTTDALKKLISLKPLFATVIKDGAAVSIKASEVAVGDIFIVKPGETIPVDGVIIKGTGAVDESALTGESIPCDKDIGNAVYSATTNLSGYLECRAVSVGEDTTLSKIIQIVSDTVATKAPIARVADKVSGIFVPIVIIIAIITLIIWSFTDKSFGFSLARAISVLVISCPCALGLATPVAITVGNGVAARKGILFKNAAAIENCGKIKNVILDKTGTITLGKPIITDIIPLNSTEEQELLTLANSLERYSEHPLAKAITDYSIENNIGFYEVSEFTVSSGNGLCGMLNGKKLSGGKYDYISKDTQIYQNDLDLSASLADDGKTPLYFSYDGTLIGIIAVADSLKEESEQAIKLLKLNDYNVVMLTGDNKRTAKAIGKKVGIDEIISDVLPDKKADVVKKYCLSGPTAMIGDGINDAPALTVADVGIAIGAGSDIAVDAADIVLMKNSLADAFYALMLGKATLKNIKQNLFWAFIYNIICIPLAAGAFIPIFNFELNPMLAAAAMSLSSFCVVSNALRLNAFKIKTNLKGNKKMTITLKIEGMMCPHCEAHVKNALEALNQVDTAEVSHETGTAVITLNSDVSEAVLKETVEKQGYKVL